LVLPSTARCHELGHSQAELAELFGSRSRASEIPIVSPALFNTSGIRNQAEVKAASFHYIEKNLGGGYRITRSDMINHRRRQR
jgi:hypothetical protein